MKKLSLAVLVGIGLTVVGISSASAVTIEPPVGDSKISMASAQTGESFILPTISENLVTDEYEVESVEVLMPEQLKGDLSTDKRSVAISINEDAPEKIYPITFISETTKTVKECTDTGCSSSQTRLTHHSHFRVTVDNPNFNSSSDLKTDADTSVEEVPEIKSDSTPITLIAPTRPKAPPAVDEQIKEESAKEEVAKTVTTPEKSKPEVKTTIDTKVVTPNAKVTEKATVKAVQAPKAAEAPVSDSKAIEHPGASTTGKTAVKPTEERTAPVEAPITFTDSNGILSTSSIVRPVMISSANTVDEVLKPEVLERDSKVVQRSDSTPRETQIDSPRSSHKEFSGKSDAEKLHDLEKLDKEQAVMGKIAGFGIGAITVLALTGLATALVIANQSISLARSISNRKSKS
ncbi:hypothetical protein DFO58_1330 [Arthrobacter sp. AG1021]|uniref:hypothetical protein n=1 Tax=Arthrobacter sp. AG1021 TaxID=2183908 RepID=UPI000F197FEF|nr:hypothetical protein [Arthrobacter sp. AG1021]RKS20790.1 hypothetical protein DFO58_1330 [Arthrobacter sp. AG1021]